MNYEKIKIPFLFYSLILACSSLHCGKPHLTPPPPSAIWDGHKASYCHLNAARIQRSTTPLFNPENAQEPVITPEQVQHWISENRIQEAIWGLERIGNPESLHRAELLKRHLSLLLNNEPYSEVNHDLGGSLPKKLLTFSGEVSGIFKPMGDWSNPNAEVGAYQLDVVIGLRIVPITVLRTIDGELGSIQYFMTQVRDGTPSDISSHHFTAMKVLDYLTGNTDRWAFNFLYSFQQGNIIAIDNGAGFTGSECGSLQDTVEFVRSDRNLESHITETRLDTLRDALRPYFSSEIVDLTVMRMENLQTAIREL